jgi:hypothetical protein
LAIYFEMTLLRGSSGIRTGFRNRDYDDRSSALRYILRLENLSCYRMRKGSERVAQRAREGIAILEEPQSRKRTADTVAAAIRVAKIATGETEEMRKKI